MNFLEGSHCAQPTLRAEELRKLFLILPRQYSSLLHSLLLIYSVIYHVWKPRLFDILVCNPTWLLKHPSCGSQGPLQWPCDLSNVALLGVGGVGVLFLCFFTKFWHHEIFQDHLVVFLHV